MAPDFISEIGELSLLVNGEQHRIAAPCNLAGLVRGLSLETRRIAIAVNGDVVPRSCFAERALESGDRIEILEAVGGG